MRFRHLPELAARAIVLPPAYAVMRVLFDLTLKGTRHIPAEGPGIVVANHAGFLDPFLLQAATHRPLRFLMTSDFFDMKAQQWFYRFVRAIRVNENGPPRDSIRGALDVLKASGLVGLFPEGQLSPDGNLSPLQPGISFLASRSKVPVVPAWIDGSYHVCRRGQLFPRRHRLTVTCGAPFTIESPRDRSTPERILAAWDELRG
ncbi:MAG: lysophospholipid acyltransferase family protein [Planctomycetota bacterium]